MANYTLTFGQVSGNVNVDITPSQITTYQADIVVVNGLLSGPATRTVEAGKAFTVEVSAYPNHILLSNGVTVTGASFVDTTSLDGTNYLVKFINPTGKVNISIRLVQSDITID